MRNTGFIVLTFLFVCSAWAQSPIVINEILFDIPKDLPGDANGDGERSPKSDEFIELVNSGESAEDISGWQILQKNMDVVFTFPDGVVLEPNEFCVVFGGVGEQGFSSAFPSTLKIFSAQAPGNAGSGFSGGGRSNYSNKGDNVILRNAAGEDIAEIFWGYVSAMTPIGIKLEAPHTVEGESISSAIRQSVTRDPDITGLWAKHTTVGDKSLFSPGRWNTGNFVKKEPLVRITSPTLNKTFEAVENRINLTGNASDDVYVTEVRWTNDRGGNGIARGRTNWSIDNIALERGVNLITVIALDAGNNTGSDTLTVVFGRDSEPPDITITEPIQQGSLSMDTGYLNMAGISSDNVGVTEVRWINDRGGSGMAHGTDRWSINSIKLHHGVNVISVIARDAADNVKTAILNMTFTDIISPEVTIASPTSNQVFTTSVRYLKLGGVSLDNDSVSEISWSSNRGGAGAITGSTNWTTPEIFLFEGNNVIKITAKDFAGNTGTDTITVRYDANASPGIVGGAAMRIEGNYSFMANSSKEKGTIKWFLDRTTIEEGGGEPGRINGIASATGVNAAFNLDKIPGKETIYHIRASDNGFTDSFSVQVFQSNTRSSLMYRSAGNPDIQLFLAVPSILNDSTRMIFIMHGMTRTAENYFNIWSEWATENNYIAVVPYFDKENWPGSISYNQGNIFRDDEAIDGLNPESKWSFKIVDNIAESIKSDFALSDKPFDMWGHSAGGQFIQRFVLFQPNANLRFSLAANPGWYMLPDLTVLYPYGLSNTHLSFTRQDIIDYTSKHLILMRGTLDVERTSNVRQTPEADSQGSNRFERAEYFFQKGLKISNSNFNWKLIDVPDVGHSSTGMALAAQELLEKLNLGSVQ